jgi:hypothetical protein
MKPSKEGRIFSGFPSRERWDFGINCPRLDFIRFFVKIY